MTLNRRQIVLNGLALGVAGLPSAAKADLAPLRVGDQRGSTRALLQASGQLNNVPYKLEWSIFPVGAPLVEAMSAGAVDFGYVGDATATFALAGGAPIKTINVFDFHGRGAEVLVPVASAIHTIQDLRGKRIALVKGSSGHLLVVSGLRKVGLTAKDVTIVPLSAADAHAAIISDSVDAWAIWEPYSDTGVLRDHLRVLFDSKGIIEEVECGVASDAAIAAKRPQLLDFIARVKRAYTWGLANREAYAQAYSADTKVPIDISRYIVNRNNTEVIASVPDRSIALHQKVADLYLDIGLIPQRLDIRKAYDLSFKIK